MIKFAIDEDMPRSTAKALRAKGIDALDIRDYGLRGKSDDEVFSFAQKEEAIILTGDRGFGNLFRFSMKVEGVLKYQFPCSNHNVQPFSRHHYQRRG